MNPNADFGETSDVAVTVLVDNRADLLVKPTDGVKYFMDRPLLAEHGFAALIHLKNADIRILWDAGITRISLLENMRRMEIDPSAVDKIVLSHGHPDHTGAMTDASQGDGFERQAQGVAHGCHHRGDAILGCWPVCPAYSTPGRVPGTLGPA